MAGSVAPCLFQLPVRGMTSATDMRGMPPPFHLMALEHFSRGERGHAVEGKVTRLRAGLVVDDGVVVRALENVRPGDRGLFEEVPQDEAA